MAQLLEDEKINNNNNNNDFEFNLFSSKYFQLVNKCKLKKIDAENIWRSAFGNLIIDISGKTFKNVIWKIKINNTTSKYIMIGVCKDEWNSAVGSYTTQYGYMYYAYNGNKYSNSSNVNYTNGINANGSIVLVNLDIINKTVSFNIDNKDAGIAYSNLPNGKYRLAIDLYSASDEIEVLSQETVFDSIVLNMVDNITQLQNYYKTLNLNIKKGEEKQLLSKLSIEQLLKEAQYMSELEEKNKLLDKEIENFNKNLENFKKNLKNSLYPDIKNYKNWKIEDIIKWIITLDNGIYSKYTDTLLESFKKNKIEVEHLCEISKNDLLAFGVDVFIHRVNLVKHLQQLTNQNNNNNNKISEGEYETADIN